VSEIFTTAVDNQPFVSVHVLQGERPLADDNTSLARFDLVGIPPAPRGMPQIEVTFTLDASGILAVAARDLGSGREQTVRVSAASGLNEDQIERIIVEAEEWRAHDEEQRERVELQNRARGLLYTAERSIEEYAEFVSGDDADAIREAISVCREVLQYGGSVEELQQAVLALEDAAYRLADAMYAQVESTGGADASADGGEGAS